MTKIKVYERKNMSILLYPCINSELDEVRYLVTHIKTKDGNLEAYKFYRHISLKKLEQNAFGKVFDNFSSDDRFDFNSLEMFEYMYKIEINDGQFFRNEVGGKVQTWELETPEFTGLINDIWIWSNRRFKNTGLIKKTEDPFMCILFKLDNKTLHAGFGPPMDRKIIDRQKTYSAC